MLTIETARVFEPLLKPSRYKGAWGGRGSGKSHYMAGDGRYPPNCSSQQMCIALVFSRSPHESLLTELGLLVR
jgi:hypothetical protein